MQKMLTPLAIIIAGIIIAGSNMFVNGSVKIPFFDSKVEKPLNVFVSPTPGVIAQPTQKALPKDISLGKSPIMGSESATVTVIEYSDYQCPYCAAVFGIASKSLKSAQDPNWEPIIPNLQKDYIDKGLVKFVYKDFAFLGDESIAAANAALCAGDQGKYWQYHDALFNSQGGENSGAFKDANLVSIGKSLNLNSTKFSKCVTSREHLAEVQESTSMARTYGVNSTPSFFVNNIPVERGAVSYSVVKAAIEKALNK